MNYNNVELFGFASSGKIKMWKASTDLTLNTDSHIEITVEWGYVDGKKQTKKRTVKTGKNIGKANQTTIEEQALLDLSYLYTAQLDSGYVTKDQLEHLRANPIKSSMLATKFKDKQHLLKTDEHGKFIGRVFIQPKLNGIRCQGLKTTEDTTKFISRTNKPFAPFTHLSKQILNTKLETNKAFDHELFNPKLPFEVIASLVNSEDHLYSKGTDTNYSENDISMYIYDIMGYDDEVFSDRLDRLTELSSDFGLNMHFVETIEVFTMEEIHFYLNKYIKDGYEGLMVRLGEGKYEYGKRSSFLIKFKIMEQEEAEILDIFLAPQDPSKVMFKLRTNNPVSAEPTYATFDCSIIGNKQEALNTYYLNKKEYIGKFLTFNYQALSLYGVPLFAVGQYIREGSLDKEGNFIPEV